MPDTSVLLKRVSLALTLCCAAAPTLSAQNIVRRATGLSGANGSVATFDFNGLGLPSGSVVSTQLQASGLVFQGAGFGTPPDYAPYADGALYNVFNSGFGQLSSDFVDITFATKANGVAFNFATYQATSTFTVWNNGLFVRSFQFDVPDFADPTTNNFLWWGFEFTDGTLFDKLTIAGSPYGFGFDNLQVSTPITSTVPEPGTVGLLALGLVGFGVMIRRRRSR